MGYEIAFKFFKKKSEGFGYDTEGEPEVMKVAVGKQWDDVDLDEVAKSVFGQMAKRNILIVDAEIYEYTKKKISFKMKDEGIVIKNRKFSYDITGAIKSENENNVFEQQSISLPSQPVISQDGHVLEPHEILAQQQRHQPMVQVPVPVQPVAQDLSHLPPEVQHEIRSHQMTQVQQQRAVSPFDRMRPVLPPPGQPIRHEVYDPHPDLARVAAQKRLPFTIGKRYPIYEEKPDRRGVVFGMIYVTEDDQGNRRALNDKHFVPLQNLTNFESDARPNHIARVAVEDNQVNVNGRTMNLPDIYTLGRRR
jgi:hypothetical protein